MNSSRSINATKNVIVGVVSQVITLVLSVVSRRIFVSFLSAEYLGINGLYSNILSVLALAELGLGNVAQYFLYKPVAEKRYEDTANLVHYFKKLYRIIAFAVLSIGILLIPFLNVIVNSDLSQNELIVYYVLFLLNSVVSYFSADKLALLAANQDNRLQKYVAIGSTILFQIVYIVVLVLWHNYTIYVVVTILCTLCNVVTVNLICYKRYPYIKKKNKAIKVQIDENKIINDIKSTFLYKIGATIVNNTSNIMISVLISTAMVGLYSNYYMIVVAVQGFVAIVSKALVSGIGNLSVTQNSKRMQSVFNTMLLIYNFIAAFGGISLFLLFNDFIPLWLGDDYILNKDAVFAIAFQFYLTNAISPLWIFREANGMFKKVKYLFLFTSAFNIMFSVILGKAFGLFGILFAPSLARIVTQVWYEPYILYKNLFCISSKAYWMKQLKYFLSAAVSFALCYYLQMLMPSTLFFIIIKAFLFFVIVSFVFFGASTKTEEQSEIFLKVKNSRKRA